MTLRRTAKLARTSEEHRVALAVPLHGPCRLITGQQDAVIARREMLLVDLSEPYRFGWSGSGSSFAFQIPLPELNLPVDTVHRAAGRLNRSPLYPLVRDHVITVTTGAEMLTDPGGHPGHAGPGLRRAAPDRQHSGPRAHRPRPPPVGPAVVQADAGPADQSRAVDHRAPAGRRARRAGHARRR
jgi:hypothetical protein